MADNKFINYKDFDIKNIRLCECKDNNQHKFKTWEIKYVYPDGEESGLRLRSPVLFSYGVAKFKSTPEHYMSLIPVYNKENPGEKEAKFEKTLNSISKFLREEWEKENKKSDSEDLEIIKDNIFFPRLKGKKFFENNDLKECKIKTIFYEKKENGKLIESNPNGFKEIKCKVVAYIDMDDIFSNSSTLKVRLSISDVIILRKGVPPPPKLEKNPTSKSEVTLGSDDEE